MKNTTINLGVVKKIAHALGDLNERVVFVGGAVVSLYINDPAADDVRPTKDVDISLEILSVGELENLRLDLIKKGFRQTVNENVICRFLYEDIKVDVMSTKAVGWAPSDQWYGPGFKYLQEIKMDTVIVRILPLAYFLASKFDAYHDRGSKDPRTSPDFEDIIYILDNRMDLIDVILSSPTDVLSFLKSEFQKIIKDQTLQEAVAGNLYYETRTERFELMMNKLKSIVDHR
jgi:predicted nucleotidyltransferase